MLEWSLCSGTRAAFNRSIGFTGIGCHWVIVPGIEINLSAACCTYDLLIRDRDESGALNHWSHETRDMDRTEFSAAGSATSVHYRQNSALAA